MALAAASVAACPSEADCSLFSTSAGSRGIGVSCRPGCRKAAESATSAKTQGPTAASRWALGGSAARLECTR